MKHKSGELIKKFSAALCVGAIAVPAFAQSPAPEEQSAIETFRNFSQCVQDHRPIRLKAEENYQQQLRSREEYIRNRAEELARKRADAAMHIIMGGALSEGFTAEETEHFVENIVRADTLTIQQQLQNLVDLPQAPVTSSQYCSIRMQIDLPSLRTQIKELVEKYGRTIVNDNIDGLIDSPKDETIVTLSIAPPPPAP